MASLCATLTAMQTHAVAAAAPAVPKVDVPVWAWLLVVFAAAASYFIMLENGALLAGAAETLHEFFHHGRHFVGVPCH